MTDVRLYALIAIHNEVYQEAKLLWIEGEKLCGATREIRGGAQERYYMPAVALLKDTFGAEWWNKVCCHLNDEVARELGYESWGM